MASLFKAAGYLGQPDLNLTDWRPEIPFRAPPPWQCAVIPRHADYPSRWIASGLPTSSQRQVNTTPCSVEPSSNNPWSYLNSALSRVARKNSPSFAKRSVP